MGETNKQLSSIMTDLVMSEVERDKRSAYEASQQKKTITTETRQETVKEDEFSDTNEWRERRLEEMKKRRNKREELLSKGHGKYEDILESEFLEVVTKTTKVVCHFYEDSFERCKIVDLHLKTLAPQHVEAKFVRIRASKSPFFVQKLHIRTLPSIVFFNDGKAIHTVIGFDELGGSDSFKSNAFRKLLIKHDIVNAPIGTDMSDDSDDE